jgi:4-amino-4-deoxy-L-arabinose transferase-like glycosyltransferase
MDLSTQFPRARCSSFFSRDCTLGQEYARLVFGQTLVFVLLPVALYFLGKLLHSRAAGLTVALLAIFRELTSLWVASDARVSNTKMLLSDFITTLVLIVYLLLVLRWFREKRGGLLLAFASGGALGLQLLLRTQAAFIAPGIILLALLVFWPDWKKWIAQSALFAVGLVLAISPWLVRNYFVTGQASLDDPIQIKAVASMYSGGTPTSNFSQFEGQTPAQMSRFVVETILQRPGYVAGFVSNQFFSNTLDTLLVLPIFARYDGLTAPIYPYWGEWDGHFSPENTALFIIYLAVIALGFAAAWKRLRWAGLLPLVFFIFYAFSTSLARFSGWRYIFPADWVGYFYFALGAVELFSILLVLFGADAARVFDESGLLHSSLRGGWSSRRSNPRAVEEIASHTCLGGRCQGQTLATPALAPGASVTVRKKWLNQNRGLPELIPFAALAGLILLVGGLPWMAEIAIPRAEPVCADAIPACLAAQGVDEAQVRAFLSQPGAVALTGRSLYPRYFPRNDGLASTNPNPAFAPRDFPRMGFYFLTSDGITQSILPMKGSRPFPHAADGILLGCQRNNYVEVRMIVFPAARETFTSGVLADPCPTP